MTTETPTTRETPEEPDSTVPPDETEVDPGAGSPVPDGDKEQGPAGPDPGDPLPAPTPGM
jgi:hypothetical protein